jgi:hypothetical protein
LALDLVLGFTFVLGLLVWLGLKRKEAVGNFEDVELISMQRADGKPGVVLESGKAGRFEESRS